MGKRHLSRVELSATINAPVEAVKILEKESVMTLEKIHFASKAGAAATMKEERL
jgi:hypothetical protein